MTFRIIIVQYYMYTIHLNVTLFCNSCYSIIDTEYHGLYTLPLVYIQ